MPVNKTYEKYIHEILDEVQKLEDRDERIAYLKKEGNTFAIKSLLQLAYNDKITFDLPKGKPPFTPCPEGREPMSVNKAFRGLSKFCPGSKLNRLKKEQDFIRLLEVITPTDADLLCAAKDGTLVRVNNKAYSKITKSLVEATFPDLLK